MSSKNEEWEEVLRDIKAIIRQDMNTFYHCQRDTRGHARCLMLIREYEAQKVETENSP